MVAGHLQEKNDFYYIVLSYKDADGKRKTKWEATGLSVKRNKKKAEALLLERRRNFMVPTAPAEIRLDDDILFSDFMLKWLEVTKSSVQITTYASYQGMVERIIAPYFRKRGIKLVDLKATDLQDFYTKQLERVKANSVIHYHANIHKALKYAVKIDLIPTNPADKVERPKKNAFKGSYYSAEEIHALTEVAEGTKLEIPVLLVTLLCCLLIGVLNGLLVAKFKLPPFIATLGTMTVARGIAQLVNGNYNTDSIMKFYPEAAQTFKNVFYYGKTLGLYNGIWIAIILWIVFNFLLSKTRTGRYIYATGSNIDAARLSGVNVVSTTVIAYVVSAFCSFVVGIITCATVGQGTMDAGNSYEMYAVAASVIGGVSTLGGQGILLGTVVGAAIWGTLQNGLQFAGAPVAIRNIIIGIIVVLSVLMDVVIRTGRRNTKGSD